MRVLFVLLATFQENDLGDMRPKYFKAKEKTAHVTQRLETKKYAK